MLFSSLLRSTTTRVHLQWTTIRRIFLRFVNHWVTSKARTQIRWIVIWTSTSQVASQLSYLLLPWMLATTLNSLVIRIQMLTYLPPSPARFININGWRPLILISGGTPQELVRSLDFYFFFCRILSYNHGQNMLRQIRGHIDLGSMSLPPSPMRGG